LAIRSNRYDEIVERRIDLGTALKRARAAAAAVASSSTPRSSTKNSPWAQETSRNTRGVKIRPVQSSKKNGAKGAAAGTEATRTTGDEEVSDGSAIEPYASCVELVEDCRVTFHNCVVYNADGSAIVRMAKYLDKVSYVNSVLICRCHSYLYFLIDEGLVLFSM